MGAPNPWMDACLGEEEDGEDMVGWGSRSRGMDGFGVWSGSLNASLISLFLESDL